MKLSPLFAKKLFICIILAIAALVSLMMPVDGWRIHDKFLTLLLSLAVTMLIIYIFFLYRNDLKKDAITAIKKKVIKYEPGIVFPDDPGSVNDYPEK